MLWILNTNENILFSRCLERHLISDSTVKLSFDFIVLWQLCPEHIVKALISSNESSVKCSVRWLPLPGISKEMVIYNYNLVYSLHWFKLAMLLSLWQNLVSTSSWMSSCSWVSLLLSAPWPWPFFLFEATKQLRSIEITSAFEIANLSLPYSTLTCEQ